ncbi:MAG: GAF domain-containing protein [Blastocatellia bacterium]|nr:GAF domain-containing protein [Blastocatellia bacterium]
MLTCFGLAVWLLATPAGQAQSPRHEHPAGAPTTPPGTEITGKTLGDTSRITRPAFRIFNNKNGLPHNRVDAVAFDPKGYLWVGTQDGPAYFNGRVWTVVPLPQRTVSNFIRSLLVGADGSVWFGSDGGGLSRLKPDGEWETYDRQGGLPDNVVRCLFETVSPDGTRILWAGTDAGLGRFAAGQWTSFTVASGLPNNVVWDVAEDRLPDGTPRLWVATEGGLACLTNGRWTTYTTGNGLPNNIVYAVRPVRTANGSMALWVGTEGGLARLEADRWTSYDTKSSGLPNNVVMNVLESVGPNGNRTVWVATYGGGLARFANDIWTVYDQRSGFPSNQVRFLRETVSTSGIRTLWVGTYGGGLVRMEDTKWQVVDSPALNNKIALSFLETTESDGTHTLWMGTNGGGLACFANNRWTIFDTASGLPANVVSSLLETTDEQGNRILWAATFGGGLARLEKGRWSVIDNRSGLPSNWVTSLLETKAPDGTRTLWVGTYGGGLARLEKGHWDVVDASSGLANNWVLCLLETVTPGGKQTIWVGTRSGGLSRFENGLWSVLNVNSGLPNNWVWSLYEQVGADGNRTLWVGTMGGVTRFSLTAAQPKPETFNETTVPALPNKVVHRILEDSRHRLYLCTNKGVTRLTPRAPTADNRAEFDLYTYTTEDGLPDNESINLAGKNLTDSRGRMWVGTVEGGAMLDLTLEVPDRTPKPLYLERAVTVADRAATEVNLPVTDGATLAYDQNRLVFQYALLSFFRESETLYRTQMVGLDREPSAWNTDWKREFTTLPAGDYVFRVWGRDYAGNVSGPVQMAFTIRPAPWRTIPAYVLYAVLMAGAGYGVFNWRVREFKRRQLERVEHLRQLQQQRLETLGHLLESTRVINSQLDLTTVLQNIAEEGARLIDGEPGGIGLVEAGEVVFKRVWKKDRWDETPLAFRLGEGVAGQVAANGQALIINDPAQVPNLRFPEKLADYEVHGWMDVPIRSRKGKIVGVLDVRLRPERGPFTELDRQVMESFANQAAVAIENAALYGEVENQNLELEEKNLVISESLVELKRLYQQEQEVIRTLQDLNRMKTNFIVVTSHEMRTPLTVLKGYTEALLDEFFGPLTEPQRHSLVSCRRMVERMIKSFNDILEMLKINEERSPLNPVAVNLSETVQNVIQELQAFAEQRRQRIRFDGPEQVDLLADSEKLQLVFVNLIQNAIKFTYDDGEIRIGIVPETDVVHITVRDSGIGLADSELDRVFEKFYTSPDPSTHTSGLYEFSARGAGLGLAIAKNYVEAHGGRIWAESAGPGQGSCFHVMLPLVKVEAELSCLETKL